ncbi:Septation ring formation regulator EzrA [Apilactobacillus kunkeei]|nr:Septation ring formation regulator EzrA [Apilactobacillus kunkeei]CAI2583880.1 Septation ring formation regulator EzrA [Apilactobacillus kunkeei]CAI2801822.1 Septation ring formation regulator EzrA [Apilactobacillus kunkeei]
MIDLVIFVIIVLVVLLLAAFFYRKNLFKRLDSLEEQKANLKDVTVGDELDATAKIKLNGETFDRFNEYKEEYNKIANSDLLDIRHELSDAEDFINGYKLLSASVILGDLGDTIEVVKEKLDNIHDGLTQLQEVDSLHHKAVEDVDNTIREINQKLLSQNYSFGPSSEKLEDKLSSIRESYNEFVAETDNGDQNKAEHLLSQVKDSIKELNELMEIIPDTYISLSKEFPKQLDEIERGHRTMIQTDYNFTEDTIDDTIDTLKGSCQEGLKSLADLDIPETKKKCTYIEETIDSMYAIMEKEIVAKRKVKKNTSLVYNFIFHAKNQNRILSDELEGLSKNYNLEHDEIEKTAELAGKISEIEAVYNSDYDAINSNKAVYSVIQKHQQDAKQELSSIEKQQKDINDSVAELSKEERVARDSLQKFDLQLLNIRRRIDNLNLPGLTEDFLERYDYAYNEVSNLSASINQVKISMDEINQKLANISDTMDQLLSDTENIVDSAMLSERLMQFANRYKNNNEDLNAACAQAKDYFDNRYQYEKSLATMAAAIEKVNPGAYKQMETEYYNEKKTTK